MNKNTSLQSIENFIAWSSFVYVFSWGIFFCIEYFRWDLILNPSSAASTMAYLDFKGTVSSVVEYISIYLLLPLQTLTILFFMLKVYAEKANITLAGNWFRHIGFFAVSLIFELLFVLNFIQLAA